MMPEPQGYYAASAGPDRRHAPLEGSHRADICIVGAGYTGLSAALTAARAGARIALIEADTIGFGASGRNGGQIHTGLRKDQSELETWLGAQHARDLWFLTEESKSLVRSLVETHRIACELKSGLVIAAHNESAARALATDTEHLARVYGYTDARMMDASETRAQLGTALYPAARFDSGGGHLHPLLYARGLAAAAEQAGATIYENSPCVSFDRGGDRITVRARNGSVIADQLILACDAFAGTVAPELDRFIGHVESFVTATAPLPPDLARRVVACDAAVADTRHVLDYYRKSADRRLLFAGREAYFRMPSDIAALVRPRMLDVFPELASVPTEYAWSGTVGITVTRMPHFGRLSERILFAHGYSGQGVVLATLGGKLLAEAAMGDAERFETFARVPARAFPGGRALRKPLIAAALLTYKVLDAM
jgi:gamma-glutamylputrescine oxidase